MNSVHKWWEKRPEECFWLGVTTAAIPNALAAPRVDGQRLRCELPSLISHIRAGDVVFHYDKELQAITGRSVAAGAVRRSGSVWSRPPVPWGAPEAPPEWVPSLVLPLGPTITFEPAVTLAEIARAQWTLFPVLRDFEDQVGEPLYYPFAIDGPERAHLQSGHVFKLPRAFVDAIPALRGSEVLSVA